MAPLAIVAAKRGLVHRIKKMLKPVVTLVHRTNHSSKTRVPPPEPTEADLDNLANEALEEKLMLAENAANEARVRVLHLIVTKQSQTESNSTCCGGCAQAQHDFWPEANTLSRRQRAEQQRPL